MRYFSTISIFLVSTFLIIFTFFTSINILQYSLTLLCIVSIVVMVVSLICYYPIKPDTQNNENLRMYGIFAFIMGAISLTLVSLEYIKHLLI